MSQKAEFRKEESVVGNGSSLPTVTAPPSCRKKAADVNEGFVKDLMSHIDDFVHASYDEHKSCLQKTVRKMFGMNKAVESSASSAPPPVVSVLPLRVDTSTG
ncbi:unnamed protein product [Calypogeia fissa]